MKESIVLYPAPGSHQIISMVELARLISQHHPNLPITILLTSSTPFETSTTSSTYINLISSDQNQTNPNLPISFFTLPSLHLHQSHIENPVESAIEFMRLNIPNVLQALETISQSSKVLAFITSSVHHPYDPQIPTYFYFTSCASALALFLYLPIIHNQTPKSFRDLNDAVLHFPGLPPLRASQMPLPLLNRGGPAYEYFLNFAACLPKSQGIITNTFQALEPSAIKAISNGSCVPNHQTPPIFHIGPLNFDAKNRASSACEDRSTGAFSEAQLSEIAMGLERSKQRFLWVVRSPPGSSSVEPDLEILLPKEFLERTKNRGLVVKSWAPQAAILRHGCVGGFVTHCGWNSVLEAVTYGVPMAAWPLYAEQAVNGVVLVEEMKLGIPVESKEGFVSADEVEKKVSLLMDEKSLRERSQAIKAMALAAWNNGGSSFTSFSKMVTSWKQ
ncbi:PREDICTED: anthocyanidin 5,3-O-glucosyltransferase-like [Prunus mume]|uniref:Glycosyltransferase n=1 Tax=Prunus mume TaxID=102107 RepID=A0ABM0NTS1_PRUMU|nr:PREDICTED: anthocyanidin 5,3-O-glucosyltransferase-like [Prunus mume]